MIIINQKETIRKLGFPDKINPKSIMMSKFWICSNCGADYLFSEKQRPPAPCKLCGSIAFEKRGGAQ